MGWMNQAATSAERVDSVFLFVFALSAAFLVFITGLMIYFVWRYSRKRHPKAESIEGHAWLEITWTAIPLALFLLMFYYGWTEFSYTRNPPRDAMAVEVLARQWAWSFTYPNGRQTGELFAALGRPLRLDIRSADVIHGFFVPAFRLKMDAVPGKVNTTWFEPTQLGAYDIECTVICGADHSYMLSKVVVVPEEEFKEWYFGPEDAPLPGARYRAVAVPAARREAVHPGLAVLEAKSCTTCHSLDGSVTVGPTFKGAFGRKDVVETEGTEREVTVDEAYLRRAIQEPNAEVVKGYPPAMPENPLSEGELEDVVAFLKTLK
jgi:cytochrome c oxidase subunit 2